MAPSWELHRVLAVEKVPQTGSLAPHSRLCRRLGVFGCRWLCCCRWWRTLLRFLALSSLVPSCRLGSSSSLEPCCGCWGRHGFGWRVDTLDRRGGLVGVSAFAAPRRVIEIQGFDVELFERVEVHRRVESTASSYAIQSAGRSSSFVLRPASEKLSRIGRNMSRKKARSRLVSMAIAQKHFSAVSTNS